MASLALGGDREKAPIVALVAKSGSGTSMEDFPLKTAPMVGSVASGGVVLGTGLGSSGVSGGLEESLDDLASPWGEFATLGIFSSMPTVMSGVDASGGTEGMGAGAGGGGAGCVQVVGGGGFGGLDVVAVELLDPGGHQGLISGLGFVINKGSIGGMELILLIQGRMSLEIKRMEVEAEKGVSGELSSAERMGHGIGCKKKRIMVVVDEELEDFDGVGAEFPDPIMG